MRLRRLLPTFMLVLVMGGLVFQALQGERGLRGWQELRAKNEERAVVLAGLEEENAATMTQVLRLSAGSLDLDFLDERARLVAGRPPRKHLHVVEADEERHDVGGLSGVPRT